MKNRSKLLCAVLGAALMTAGGQAFAESTYGYNAAGAGPVTATARVNFNVAVPLLVLLRVGGAGGSVDAVNFALTPTVPGIATLSEGSSVAGSWNPANAPTFAATPTGNALTASAWTNSPTNASVTCSATTAFAPASGLASSSIQVASSAPVGGGLAHPGTTTACGTPTTLTRNNLQSSTWTFTLAPGALTSTAAGSYTQQVTYTATTL
ncbi:hypothetical protein [Variovorax boronicumulans]|uniref:hypothetical protein n=1 Tax=Variovorax boronicumulans TaxID=436515 RepID=UPI0012E65A27|nr:hypothetical protein [Variovorax boronicumulans]GER21352.1 hypothetical protein VCH24_64040 [Variovorax boronicumulans]